MEEIESKNSDEIRDLVNDFDLNYERSLKFNEVYKDGKSIKKYLDSLIEKGTWRTDWDEIAVTSRRMIICDRELDLKEGRKLMNDTRKGFEKHKREMFEDKHEVNHKDQLLYESIRYANACGLISYRRGDYSSASHYFEEACKLAKNSRSMNVFVPDMTSNVIRAEFDRFRYTLPQREITEYYYRERFESFIEKFCVAICESAKYKTDDEKLKLFYAHGMASLYHNLGDVFGEAEKINVFGSELTDLKEKRRKAHEKSLKWGKEVDDTYRQLQSKDQLCKCYGAEMQSTIKEYEKDLLKGNWIRGRQFVLQRILKRMIDKSKDTDDINDLINGIAKFDDETITVEGGLKIGEDEEDKIVALNNYNVIKDAINAGIVGIKIEEKYEEEKLLTLSNIADDKIKIAEKLRDDFSFLLYRRLAINLIRDDVFYKINQFWEKENYKECINWSEDYNCRSLIEISRISRSGKLEISDELKEEIAGLKEPIFKRNRNRLKEKDTEFLSLTLDIESDKDLTELLVAYEKVLEKPFKELSPQKRDKDICRKLIEKLKELYQEQGQETAVIRFWTLENENYLFNWDDVSRSDSEKLLSFLRVDLDIGWAENAEVCKSDDGMIIRIFKDENSATITIADEKEATLKISDGRTLDLKVKKEKGKLNMYENLNIVRAVLITRNGIQKHWQVKRDVEGTVKTINDVNRLLQRPIVEGTSQQGQQEDYNDLFEEMAPFSKKLKLYEELSNIKNLFIIPDGKLFQLPLHLLGKEGHDLRKDSSINIYYCPTLNHLLSSPTGNSATIGKESNYLWVFCPTPDLYKENGEIMPKISILDIEENGKNNVVLKYGKATLKSFFNAFKSNNKFTHIGFSTHGLFHDNSKDAYTSPILLSDSFLTPYDVLFSLDLTGVQTVFLGACEVGSSKYTDENEAIGLVTSFLAKNTVSVIASLWKISYYTYNLFIETLNKSNILNSSEPWNLTDIFRQCESPYILSPFVQYANIGIVERRINK